MHLTIKAIALDDEPPALELLDIYCKKTESIQLVRTFTVASEAQKYINKFPVDLLFLDVRMPGILGTQLVKKLKQEIMIVFTTAYGEYAVDGFDLNVVDFLLKPFSFERFLQTKEKVKQYYLNHRQGTEDSGPHIYLRADYSLVKVPLDHLLYVEGLEDYAKFYFENDNPLVVRITLKELAEKLPATLFIRVHRSYIVRIDKCEKIRSSHLQVAGREINIGRVFKAAVLDIFKGRN